MSLRNLGHREVIKILTDHFGFYPKKQSGSHILLRHRTDSRRRTVVVPRHDPIKLGTMRSILSQAGVSEEEFLEHL